MRIVFSLVGLLLVLAIVGVLVKKQFVTVAVPPLAATPGAGAEPSVPVAQPGAAQSQLIQQQIKLSVESAMQRSKTMSEEP